MNTAPSTNAMHSEHTNNNFKSLVPMCSLMFEDIYWSVNEK